MGEKKYPAESFNETIKEEYKLHYTPFELTNATLPATNTTMSVSLPAKK